MATLLGLLFCSVAYGQGDVPLVTVATDQTELNLSNQFGVPTATAINQAGDFAFIGNGDTALFLRPTGASTIRLLQIDDEAPGFPGSKIESFWPALGLNASRVLLFEISFRTQNDGVLSALLTYDGTNYQTVVKTGDPAPPSSLGATFGRGIVPGSIDDNGDVNFAAVPVPPSGTGATTFYIVPFGKPAVRIVGLGDSPPPACTWCITPTNPILPGISIDGPFVPPLNAQGQMLLQVFGGLFIGAKDGSFTLVPMATMGVCTPQPVPTGALPRQISGFLNNAGEVAFTNPSSSGSVAICVVPAGAAMPTPAVSSGDPAPANPGGTITSPFAVGLDDSGDIAFQSSISGSSTTTAALLRYRLSSNQSQLDVIAYQCEAAPGTNSVFSPFIANPPNASFCSSGQVIFAVSLSPFSGVSIAKNGAVSFRSSLANGESAIYRQSDTAMPELIFLDTDVDFSVNLVGSSFVAFGEFPFFSGQTKILDNGSTFFATDLASGAADFAVYLGMPGPGNLQTLMSTADQLPVGARTTLLSTPPLAAGHFVAFVAQPAAGRRNLLLADLSAAPIAITQVASDNDPGLLTTGGVGRNRLLAPNFFLNDSGQVALETVATNVGVGLSALSFGTSTNPAWEDSIPSCGTIFLWTPTSGLAKVVAAGDAAPNSSLKFQCVSLNGGPPSPLNNSGHLAFDSPSLSGPIICDLCGAPPATAGPNGVYLYSSGAISEIVAANDTLAGQTQATSFVPDLPVPVNSTGQVAFGAEIGTTTQAFFLQMPGATTTTQKIIAEADPVPGSSAIFGFPHFISGLADSGNVAFTAATSASLDGLFFLPSSGAVEALALDGGPVPPAASSGTFSFTSGGPSVTTSGTTTTIPIFRSFAAINGESDVAFGATIAGGSADSGYFRAMHSGNATGTLQPVVLQGQPAPGGGTFNTVPISFTRGANFSLGPDGALAFVNSFEIGSGAKEGLFVARPDGSLVEVIAGGDTLPGGGVLGFLSFNRLAAGDAGKFAFFGRIEGANAQEGIFVTAIPPGTAGTTVSLSSLSGTVVSQQPVTLTATVVSTTTGTPTGSVAFFGNGVSLGTGTLNSSGQASVTTSSLVAGPVSLVAQYDGDSSFAPGNSPALSTTVIGFASAPSGLTFIPGQNLVIPLTLFAPPGSNMSFALSCSGLPVNTACSFDHNPVTPGPNGTMVNVTLHSSTTGSILPNGLYRGPLPWAGIGLAAFLALLAAASLLIWQPRWRLAIYACSVAFTVSLAMGGCGTANSTSNPQNALGPPPGPASFTVTGTSGATTISTVVNVTVE